MLAAHRVGDTVRGVRVPQRRNRARACARGRGHRTLPRLRGRHDHGGPLPGVQMAATGMMRDDVAERMLASLDANPERVADYMNSGRAAADMRELLRQCDAARVMARRARRARMVTEERLADVLAEVERLRRLVGE